MPPNPTTTTLAIRQTLEQHARRHGDRPAVIDRHGILTFGQLCQQASALAAERAVRPGAIIAVSSAPNAAFLVRVAAAWLRGGVPMPLDAKAPRQLREALVRRTTIGTHSCQPWKVVTSVVGGTYRPLLTGGEPPTVARKAHAVGLGVPADAEFPKLAVGVVALFASPLHLNGPFEFAVRHLLQGGTVALLDRFDPLRWTHFATEVKASWAFVAPIQIARLLDQADPGALQVALSGLRTLMHSAAPCPPEILERLLQVADPHVVAEYYGAAEYDGTFARADERVTGALPITGAELRIVDASSQPLPAGSVGIVEGRSTVGCTSHYAGDSCTTAHQWRTVGDQGILQDNGRLIVTTSDATGRAIVGGVNVALSRVHAVVTSHPAVVACQVIPTPDDAYGQVLTVRVTADRPLPQEALLAHCTTHLRPAERPRHLHITTPDQPSAEDCDHALSV